MPRIGARPDDPDRAIRELLPMMRFTARRYAFTPGIELDDLIQEMSMYVLRAWRSYDPDHTSHSGWHNYATLAAERGAISAVKAATAQKHSLLNGALYEDTRRERHENQGGYDVTAAEDVADLAPSAQERLERRERIARLSWTLHSVCTEMEREAILGSAEGETYDEIAERCGIGPKSVDNAMQRARGKLALAA